MKKEALVYPFAFFGCGTKLLSALVS